MIIDKAMLATRFVASDDGTRVNLSGVYLTPDCAVATDGRMLARVKACPELEPSPADAIAAGLRAIVGSKPEPFKPCIIPADTCTALEKALPKRSNYPSELVLQVDVAEANTNGHVPMYAGTVDNQSTFKAAKIDGEFPDYAQVYPSNPVAFRVTFNAGYLAELAKVAKAAMEDCRSQDPVVLTLEFYADDAEGTKLSGAINPITREIDADATYYSPIAVKCAKAPRFDALLMPCRSK